jgi:hypothetical protein
VYSQLIRPTFEPLLDRCEFITFEDIEEQSGRLQGLPLDSGARISGLIRGERFARPEQYVYPGAL